MRCANPLCKVESLYFRSGSLHWIDCVNAGAAHSRVEHRRIIWLCGECSRHFLVETWRPAGQQLRPNGAAASGSRSITAAA